MMHNTLQAEPRCTTALTVYHLTSGYLVIEPDGSTYACDDPASVAVLVEDMLVNGEPSYQLVRNGPLSKTAGWVGGDTGAPGPVVEVVADPPPPTAEQAREIAITNARLLAVAKLDGNISEGEYQDALMDYCAALSPEEVGAILDETASQYMSGQLTRRDGGDRELC